MNPKIIIDPFVLDYKIVRRPWTERLFTLPWRPMQKTKRVYKNRWIDIETGYITAGTHNMLMGIQAGN